MCGCYRAHERGHARSLARFLGCQGPGTWWTANGVSASRLPWLMCWGGSVTHGVPSAICPRPSVVSNAERVDRGGLLPDPGQLTSPVGVDGDGAPGSAPAARPATRSPASFGSPASHARPPRPFRGRTCDVVRSPREISRGERTTSGENLSSGRRLAGWMSENRPHRCQESQFAGPLRLPPDPCDRPPYSIQRSSDGRRRRLRASGGRLGQAFTGNVMSPVGGRLPLRARAIRFGPSCSG